MQPCQCLCLGRVKRGLAGVTEKAKESRTSRQGKPSDSWPGTGKSRQELAVGNVKGVWPVHIAAVPGFSIDNASVIPRYHRTHV